MSNRNDFENVAREIEGLGRERVATELHNAYVAGQESVDAECSRRPGEAPICDEPAFDNTCVCVNAPGHEKQGLPHSFLTREAMARRLVQRPSEGVSVGDEIDADGTWSLAEPSPHRIYAIREDGWLRVTPDGQPPYFVNPKAARRHRSNEAERDPAGLRIEQRAAYARGILRGLGCDTLYGPCACGSDHNDALRERAEPTRHEDLAAYLALADKLDEPASSSIRWLVEHLQASRELAQRRESPASDTCTRAELNAALEGMRVTVTEEVTDDVIAKVSTFLLARAREMAPHDAADELETAALDLRDGEWRRARPSSSTEPKGDRR